LHGRFRSHLPELQGRLEQYCDSRATFTYNSPDKHTGGHTYGGYSKSIVVDEAFTLRISDKLDLARRLRCCAQASRLLADERWGVKKGQKVGVVGLGGLGHMAVKFAHAFGTQVVLFTTSPGKADDAKRLGADEVVVSKNEDEMQKHLNSFDFIIDTVSAKHPLDSYLALLKRDGTMCMVGASPDPLPVDVFSLIGRRRQLVGSLIGGIRRRRRCSISARSTASRQTSSSSRSIRSMKPTSAW
jgi:uncharacterized zinc-type alcohol dehydrogenase-like protein